MAIKEYLGDGVTVTFVDRGDRSDYNIHTEGHGSEITLSAGAVYALEQFVRRLENPKVEEEKVVGE